MSAREIVGPGDLGDRVNDSIIFFKFTSHVQEGNNVSFDSTPTVDVYEDDSVTQIVTDGVTLVEDFDGKNGVHSIKLDTSVDVAYAIGKEFQVLVTGLLEGTTVARIVAFFSIEDRFMRGTNAAALASVATEARLAELDAANLPANIDTINTATGGLAGAAMRGTDNAALASEVTAARMSELDAGTGGKMANEVDLIKTEANKIALADAGAGVTGSVIEEVENRATPAQVNTEVVDVIDTDVSGEPAQGAPPVSASLRAKNDHIYKVFRNKKEQVAGEWRLFNDAGNTVDSKATTSDAAGTLTKEEVVSGP